MHFRHIPSLHRVIIRSSTTLGALALVAGCGEDGGSELACGAGTERSGNNCVATPTSTDPTENPVDEVVPAPAGNEVACGAGTTLVGNQCMPMEASLACGEGTVQMDGSCVAVEEPEEEEPLLSFELGDEPSGYAELIEGLDEMGANDGQDRLDQERIAAWISAGMSEEQLAYLFDHGDELTEIEFRVADGVGSLMAPDGSPLESRFTRVPTGTRFTGPNAESCLSCHGSPIGNAGGLNVANVMQDPEPGVDGLFNSRQTISINGGGLVQILAEDMTEELQALKAQALAEPDTEVALTVKDGSVNFGSLTCDDDGACNYENVVGISPDLVVRPMGWKGNFPTLRGFSSDAAFGEMGMQPDEVLWKQVTDRFSTEVPDVDGDGDGVTHELSVGDVTALTIYLAMQEMPTSVMALADQGSAELPVDERAAITAGAALFSSTGCGTCHVASFALSTTEFMEPSPRAGGAFTDADLAGRVPGYAMSTPLVADLSGELSDLPRIARAADGTGIIEPYTDLKRHFMGAHLADDAKAYFPKTAGQFDVTTLPDDADDDSLDNVSTRIPLGEFLTPELWGVGNTGPWLHDGRAPTLRVAVELHGEDNPGPVPSEAQDSRDAFMALSAEGQEQLLAFLRNLVLVDMNPPEEED